MRQKFRPYFLKHPEHAALLMALPLWRPMLKREPCVYCGRRSKKKGATIDHIHPKVNGGRNGWENEAPACARCNIRKSDTPLLLFIVTNGGLTCLPDPPTPRKKRAKRQSTRPAYLALYS